MKFKSVIHENLLFVRAVQLPLAFRILTLIIMLTGAFFLLKGMWFGVLLVFSGLFFFFYKEGVVFDLEKYNVSNYFSVGSYKKIFKTRSLNGFRYLSIVRVGVVQQNHSQTISNASVDLKFKLTLIKDRKVYFRVSTDEYFKVFSLGKRLASHFNMGLLDYSKGQANWVIPTLNSGEKQVLKN